MSEGCVNRDRRELPPVCEPTLDVIITVVGFADSGVDDVARDFVRHQFLPSKNSTLECPYRLSIVLTVSPKSRPTL